MSRPNHKPQHNQQRPSFKNTKTKFYQRKSSVDKREDSKNHAEHISATEWKEKGNQAYRKNDLNRAIQCYTKAIENYSGESKYFSNRSMCYWRKGQVEKAVMDGQTACELDEHNIKAHYICGCIYAEMGKNDYSKLRKAENQFTKALRMSRTKKLAEDEEHISIKMFRLKKLIWHKNAEIQQANLKMQKILILNSLKKEQIEDENNKKILQNVEQKIINCKKHKEIPDCFICKITLLLMEDPVVSEGGFSYERKALQEHYTQRGPIEPITRKQCRGLVIGNQNLKQAINDFLQENPWAFEEESDEDYRKISFS